MASQISFQNFREREREEEEMTPVYIADVGEKPTEEEKAAYEQDDGPLTDDQVEQIEETVSTSTVETPVVTEEPTEPIVVPSEKSVKLGGSTIVSRTKIFPRRAPSVPETYVQNEEQTESNLWTSTTENSISKEDYAKAVHIQKTEEIKTYIEMVKSNQMSIDDVPFEFQAIVKTRI